MPRITILVVLVVIAGIVAVFALRARAVSESKAPADPKRSGIESLGDEAVERAKQDVKRVGWHMVAVPGAGNASGYVFTIGLWKTYHHPELVVFAPSSDPLRMARHLSAMGKRVASGEVFAEGKAYDALFGPFSGSLRKVRSPWYPEFLGTALGFYETDEFSVLQVFWSDPEGHFPWQSGFEREFFGSQLLLGETNLILANVGQEARERFVAEEGPEPLRASWAELFVDLPADSRDHALEDWRWLVGPSANLFRVTLFGDLFLQTPNGHIHWLDTGSAVYEEIAASEAEWLDLIAKNLPDFFHVSTLLALRDLGYRPQAGQVYSWRQAPGMGGKEEVANFELVSAVVHISYLGGLHHSLKDVPPGTKISSFDFAPLGPAGTNTTDPALRFDVVINGEEQYSIWPEGRGLPEGWKPVGKAGTKQECLDYIKEVWVDMRPLSLRKAMAAQGKEN